MSRGLWLIVALWMLGGLACAKASEQGADGGDSRRDGGGRDIVIPDRAGDSAGDAVDDAEQDPTGDAGDEPGVDSPAPDLREEPDAPQPPRLLSEAGDWPDCLSSAQCGYGYDGTGLVLRLDPASNEIRLGDERFDALSGTIETAAGHAAGFDSDFIGVRVDARSIVEVTVRASDGAPLDPHIITFDAGPNLDGGGFAEITSNDDRGPSNSAARTVIASPYDDVPFFIWIDEARNILASAGLGGAGYTYTVEFVVTAFVPIQFEVSPEGVTFPGFVDLARAGDLHFYRFFIGGGDWQVSFNTDNSEFRGYLIGFDASDDQLIPHGLAGDGSTTQTLVLPASSFVPFAGEHIFAVSDWFGRGSNLAAEPFDYTLTVEPQ